MCIVNVPKEKANQEEGEKKNKRLTYNVWRQLQRPQQERTRPREADSMLQLLEMYAQGQGNQEIHHSQHG